MATLAQRPDRLEKTPGSQAAQKREHAESRQEEPDTVMSRRVRHGPQDHQECPVAGDQQADRFVSPLSHGRPDSQLRPARKKPTGVTKTVQTSVLYHGSDSLGVL